MGRVAPALREAAPWRENKKHNPRRPKQASIAPTGASSSPRRSAPSSSGTTSISTARSRCSSARCSSRRATTRPRSSRASPPSAPGSPCGPLGALVFGRIGDLVGRKYTFLITIVVMGLGDRAGRRAADVRADRYLGAGAARDAAAGAGPGARRRVRRRGDVRRGARAARPARLLHELDPDHRDARLLPVARGDPRLPHRLRR